MAKVGFIGLGTMGTPMATHLQNGGHQLVVNTIGEIPKALTTGGAVVCANGRPVAAQAKLIFIMVPDTPDVEAVLFGRDGVAEGLRPGTIVVDMSSISPTATKAFAKRINDVGCGPGDLATDLGHVGNPGHPDVQAVIEDSIHRISAAGSVAGILTADERLARRYLDLGCLFTAVGSDVGILARGTEQLAARFKNSES